MNNHSPGPWTVVEDHHGTRINDAQGCGIMSVSYAGDYSGLAEPTIHDDADAHLIAAAPKMLEALEACERLLFGTLHDPCASDLYQEVCTAIANARKGS